MQKLQCADVLAERREVVNCDYPITVRAQSQEEIAKDRKATGVDLPSPNYPAQSQEEIAQDYSAKQTETFAKQFGQNYALLVKVSLSANFVTAL